VLHAPGSGVLGEAGVTGRSIQSRPRGVAEVSSQVAVTRSAEALTHLTPPATDRGIAVRPPGADRT